MESLRGTRWRIIKELSKGDKTPTQLSKILDITLPGIHRELKELERLGIIKKIGKLKARTRPYYRYSLQEFIYFIKALCGEETEKGFLPLDENIKVHFRIWSLPKKFHYILEELWLRLQPHLSDIKAIFFSDEKITVITDNSELKRFANTIITIASSKTKLRGRLIYKK